MQNSRQYSAISLRSFGMLLPERTWTSDSVSYRYGFQNQEMDNEVYGDGNAYAFEFRISDSRIGRFLSVDPLASISPNWSPYRVLYNNPINWIDPLGLLEWSPQVNEDGSTSYLAEENDDLSTFKNQYGLSDEQATSIFNENGISTTEKVAKGTKISGESVKKHTGSDILKLDFNSKIGKKGNKRVEHLLFAFDYNRKQNEGKKGNELLPLDLRDFFHHIENPQGDAAIRFKGTVVIDGIKVTINVTSFPIGHFLIIDATWPCDEIKQTKLEEILYLKYVFCYEGGSSKNKKQRIRALTIQVPSGKQSNAFEKRYLRN